MEPAYIPKEAFSLTITDEHSFITFPKIGSQRIIFGFVPLTPKETTAMEEFRKYAQDNHLTYPKWTDDDNRILLRFLQGNNFVFKKTAESLTNHVKWRETELKINESLAKSLLPYGLIYFFGRDRMFRPVLILNIRKILDMKIPLDDVKNLLLYVIEWGIRNMLLPGKVEAYSVIVDLTKVGMLEIPVGMLQNMVGILQNNYRGRMYKFFLFNAPIFIQGVYILVKPLLEKFTQQKVNVLRNSGKEILIILPETQLEVKFGGKAPNLMEFLPPLK
jgi:CRAL/TRIO domain